MSIPSKFWRRLVTATSGRRRWLVRVGLVGLIFPVLLQWALAYLLGGDARLLPPELQHIRNLLVVTAHPDDECLFFSPGILGVLGRNPDIRGGLLVFSIGNNYGLGEQRKDELMGSCRALGIDPSRCVALDHPELQDNPTEWWNEAVIRPILDEYVKKWEVDAIITFDEGGVSGHINHRAVSSAVSQYVQEDEKAPVAYALVTTSLWRKYTFLFDLPLTSLSFFWRITAAIFLPSRTSVSGHDAGGARRVGTKALMANTWHRYLKTREAFASHGSQYSWDRHLYMIVSRYVWFNDFRRMGG